jgi:hypothetical protein
MTSEPSKSIIEQLSDIDEDTIAYFEKAI